MFIMATIYGESGAAPVRLRNLSSTGALIEGPALPQPGIRVRLSRGSLSVWGDVAWQKNGRAGVRFESTVSVAEWLPRGRAGSAQQRVDEIVELTRRATARAPVENLSSLRSNFDTSELQQLKLDVQALSEALAADRHVVERHGSKLQILDIVAKVLAKVAQGR